MQFKMITKQQYDQLYKQHDQQLPFDKAKVVVKLFNPIGVGTWWLSSVDPTNELAYGVCELHEKEYGPVSLKELRELQLPFGLTVERDKWFPTNEYTLQDIMNGKGE